MKKVAPLTAQKFPAAKQRRLDKLQDGAARQADPRISAGAWNRFPWVASMKKLAPKVQKFPAAKQRRLDKLLDKNSEGTITAKEKGALEQLVAQVEQWTVANVRRLADFSWRRPESVCNVVWCEIPLGHMANRQDNDLRAANRKHRAMCRPAS